MLDNTARTIATVSIWLAFTIVMTFGILDRNYNGIAAMILCLIMLTVICATAIIATALVWKGHRNTTPNSP